MDLKIILDDLVESLPDIYGGFICDKNQGVIASQLNLISGEKSCLDIYGKVEKIFSIVSAHFPDIGGFKFCFGNTVLIASPINKFRWLFISHSVDISPALIKTTMGIAIELLRKKSIAESLEATKAAISEKTDKEQSKSAKPFNIPKISLSTLISQKGELQKPLAQMEKALSKIMGPIGTIMLEDAIIDWAQEVTPSYKNLKKLYPHIEKEFDNDSRYSRFLKLLEKNRSK